MTPLVTARSRCARWPHVQTGGFGSSMQSRLSRAMKRLTIRSSRLWYVTDQVAAGMQRRERTSQAGPEHLDLAVDRDAEPGTCAWPGGCGRHRPSPSSGCGGGDDRRQVRRRHDAALRTRRHDRLRDAARTAFFTKRREDSGELSLRGTVDELESRNTSGFIESHVRRRIGREAEPPARVSELVAAEAEVEEDASSGAKPDSVATS